MHLDDLLGHKASAAIRYYDVDGKTLMHEKLFSGVVSKVDLQMGIVLKDDKGELFKVPPAIEACKQQLDGSFEIAWAVYRTQQERADGQHEWWDWKPA
jgi:hypothetical protein